MERKYNIGIDIDQVCNKYDIENYTIRLDGRVDVDGNVDLSDRGLTKLPLEFGIVSGDFFCYINLLTTLKGAPKKVGGIFSCHRNNLTTLEFAPKEISSVFCCRYNKLTTLYGPIK